MKSTRFFTQWAIRRLNGKGITGKPPTAEMLRHEKAELMALPHAQKVAQIAATKRRDEAHRLSCDQANAIARQKALGGLGLFLPPSEHTASI